MTRGQPATSMHPGRPDLPTAAVRSSFPLVRLLLVSLTLSSGAILAACGHAQRTDATSPGAVAHDERSGGGDGQVQRTTSSENGTPLATGPAGLLQPGAIERIQAKLTSSGALDGKHAAGVLDGPTRQALRQFQSAHALPATGLPDDATVTGLGLEPKQIFRAAGGEPPS